MKKILVYGLTQTRGGVESFLLNYYKNFDTNNIQMDFISNTPDTVYKKEVAALGGKIFNVCSKKKNPLRFKKDMENIFKNHSNEYDAIWVNLCSLANIDYLKYAKKYGIKRRIVHSHNAANMFGKLKETLHNYNKKRIDRYATDFWACSDSAAKWFYEDDILNSKKFRIIKNAVDTEKFSFDNNIRNEYRKILNIEDKYVLGNIGRFHFQKNHEFLIDVFKEVKEKCDNSILLLVGNGDLEENIKEKVKNLGLEESVIFLGMRDDVNKIMQAIDIFLMPSRFEGLPVAAVEAQSSGVRCLLSDTITKEIKVTDLIEFIRAKSKEDVNVWRDKILEYKLGYDRREMNEDMKKSGFEIKEAAKNLEDFLCGNLKSED
ncbi:glycosyltransferase family 1 protein [Clostridium baratii]|uniref:Glycosyl transferases group 1 family protein n=1 Tax=Clostridium baratii str. Sullivan TaxID=1415775 RepID=A0A0A7FVA8_9CLOT|nr:glycosyltransferase family 1 protein [Clostridium baratii]AIY83574.1 glycosyl transferases group 1 family protein [Clostridium baratii str. Sullivan]MDU4912094.1 glycosyltransferase family 1 protein [Clostridium baratii]